MVSASNDSEPLMRKGMSGSFLCKIVSANAVLRIRIPHLNTDPDPSFQVKAQNLATVLKYAHILYSLACHLQIDSDPDRDYFYHFDADPDPQHW